MGYGGVLGANPAGSSRSPPFAACVKVQAAKLEKRGGRLVSWERGRRGLSERPGSKVWKLQSMRTWLLKSSSPGSPPTSPRNPAIFRALSRNSRRKIPDDAENDEDRKTFLTLPNNDGSSEFILKSSSNPNFYSHSHTGDLLHPHNCSGALRLRAWQEAGSQGFVSTNPCRAAEAGLSCWLMGVWLVG